MSIGRIIPNVNLATLQTPALRDGGISGGAIHIGNQAQSTEPSHFGKLVSDGIQSVNKSVTEFDHMSEAFAKGERVNLHEMMISGEKAALSMKLMVTLRNKVVEAYQEVMRLQV